MCDLCCNNFPVSPPDVTAAIKAAVQQLTDFAQSSSLLKQLDQMAEVNVQLIRQGQIQEIVYRLPDSN